MCDVDRRVEVQFRSSSLTSVMLKGVLLEDERASFCSRPVSSYIQLLLHLYMAKTFHNLVCSKKMLIAAGKTFFQQNIYSITHFIRSSYGSIKYFSHGHFESDLAAFIPFPMCLRVA